MNKSIFKKTYVISVFCIATLLFVLSIPMTSHGDEFCGDYEISVNVAANIVNITSQGEGHSVVVHTNQHYDYVELGETQVFVNDGENGDCEIVNFGQREDDNLHLDIYFLIDDLQNCENFLEINDEFNILRVVGVDTNGNTFCGESDMHIVGKQGPGKQ